MGVICGCWGSEFRFCAFVCVCVCVLMRSLERVIY